MTLEVSDLNVDYGIGPDAVHAVDEVDLTCDRGEVLGIAGESGSGKSTFAYAVTRLLRDPGRHHRGEAVLPRRRPAGVHPGGLLVRTSTC